MSLRSGEWFCSFCRNVVSPEMQYDCDVKDLPIVEGFTPTERRVSSLSSYSHSVFDNSPALVIDSVVMNIVSE